MNMIFLYFLFSCSLSIASPMSWLQNVCFGRQYAATKAYSGCDYEESLAIFYDLMNQDPYNPEYNYNVGTILYKQKKYSDAQQSFLRSIDYSKSTSKLLEQAYFNIGNSYYQLEEWQKAVHAYEQVLKINENNKKAQHNLQLALYKLKDQQLNDQQQDKDESPESDNDQQQEKDTCESQKNQSQQKSQDGSQNDKGDSGNQESSDGVDQNQKNMSNDDKEGSDQQNCKEQSEDDSEGQDKSMQQDGQKGDEDESIKNKQSDQVDLNSEKSLHDTLQDKGLEKKSDDGGSESNQDESVTPEADSSGSDEKEMNGVYKKPELKNKLQDQYEGKASDDDRLTDYHASIMKTLEDLEEKIQKHVIKNKVAMQGAGQDEKKGW